MEIKENYSFDDLLLTPQYSEIESRSNVDVTVKIGNLEFSNPVIPANMQTITGSEMALEIVKNKGLAILHRFIPIKEQLSIADDLINFYNGKNYFAASVGVLGKDKENISKFVKVGVNIFCIDIAHGDSKLCIDMIKYIKNNFPNTTVIAGNVATGNGAKRLWLAGADIVKVGIGRSALLV